MFPPTGIPSISSHCSPTSLLIPFPSLPMTRQTLPERSSLSGGIPPASVPYIQNPAFFNHDGEMDDFYYYRAGVLTLRVVDTNYDNQPDLWVHLDEGVYIWKIERDTNFDGNIDYVKEYGPPPAEK